MVYTSVAQPRKITWGCMFLILPFLCGADEGRRLHDVNGNGPTGSFNDEEVAQKNCSAIAATHTDQWCNDNCNNIPVNCPSDGCQCEGDEKRTDRCWGINSERMNLFCDSNCNHVPRNCPEDMCVCGEEPVRPKCRGAVAGPLDAWCKASCSVNREGASCPPNMCDCRFARLMTNSSETDMSVGYAGRVEVWIDHDHRWAPVCIGADKANADVLCKSLGFSGYGDLLTLPAYGSDDDASRFISDARCVGGETILSQCPLYKTTGACSRNQQSLVCVPLKEQLKELVAQLAKLNKKIADLDNSPSELKEKLETVYGEAKIALEAAIMDAKSRVRKAHEDAADHEEYVRIDLADADRDVTDAKTALETLDDDTNNAALKIAEAHKKEVKKVYDDIKEMYDIIDLAKTYIDNMV